MSPSVIEHWKYPERKPDGTQWATLLTVPLTPRLPKPLQTKRLLVDTSSSFPGHLHPLSLSVTEQLISRATFGFAPSSTARRKPHVRIQGPEWESQQCRLLLTALSGVWGWDQRDSLKHGVCGLQKPRLPRRAGG